MKREPIPLPNHRDWRGTPMEVGSCVVFPVSFGRGSMMKEGVVVSIEQAQDSYTGKPLVENVRTEWVDDPANPGKRVMNVLETRPVAKIGIQAIRYEDGGKFGKGARWWERNNYTDRPSYPHPDRITVVPPRGAACKTGRPSSFPRSSR